MPVDTLSLAVSSPSKSRRTIDGQNALMAGLDLPIELENGCSEAGISIDSDDVALTNAIRKHFLEHFGHRDLNGIVSDYAPDAILIQVVNNLTGDGKEERTKYHGHDEIRGYFQKVFELHPAGECSFQLEHITVEQRHGMVGWSAKTPTVVFTQGSDTLVFNSQGKIVKQFFSCQTHPREDPGTGRFVRRDSNECSEFFQKE